jgi:hypothetical protein
MSVSSCGSQMSVSYFGEEMDFDSMCDTCFKDLQTYMNDLHCKVRELAIIPEQDDDYMSALNCYLEIQTGIDGVAELLKELSGVSKQVLGKPPADLKLEVKAKLDAYKLEKNCETQS